MQTRHGSSLAGLGLVVAALTLGCSLEPLPKWPVSSSAQLCDNPALGPEDFCMPSAKIERWLKSGHFSITDAGIVDEGTSNPYKVRLRVPGGIIISAKFKPAPDDLDSFNNSPRREVAAYEMQKLFLDEDDYVVPPTVLTCLPIAKNVRLMPKLHAHGRTKCALGILAYWVENVTDDDVIDDDRWDENFKYRYHLGNLNALTILIGHQDSLGSNFLVANDEARPRLLAIDNGLSFGAMGINPVQWISSSWSSMRVKALPKRTVDRLKRIDHAKLERLLVVAQLEWQHGTLRTVPRTPPINATEGVRSRGPVIQFGLTADELAEVEDRLAGLLEQVDSGEVIQGIALAASRGVMVATAGAREGAPLR